MGIRLRQVEYSELSGTAKEWRLDGLSLGGINLIVGRNATGKTRTLNLIWTLARLFVPEAKFRTGNAKYDVTFDNDGHALRYRLDLRQGKVFEEDVILDGENKLHRQADGTGGIFTAELGRKLSFKPPTNELAAVARRDSLQHPFLEPLYDWGRAVRHYTFGDKLGRDTVAMATKAVPVADDRDNEQVVAIFEKAKRELKQPFVDAVIADMAEMHYNLEEIDVRAPENIPIPLLGGTQNLRTLTVRERGVPGVIGQLEMSQGMFRALSVLIQVNYSQMAHRANCILVDDIGEGLDFERSTRLIEIMRRKALASSFQLVMTTNDQFVMNNVPLDEWSVLQRTGNQVKVRNHENSKKAFEHFKFVGLSNFSFLEMDFLDNAPPEEMPTPNE